MTVEQSIILHGGCIVSSHQRENGTYDWDWNASFRRDVARLWSIASRNPGKWNRQLRTLEQAATLAQPEKSTEDGLRFVFSYEGYRAAFDQSFSFGGVLEELADAGFPTEFRTSGDECSVGFKDGQIQRCLSKAGTILELHTFLCAMAARKKNGSPLYSDVRTGVFIDWDGVVHSKQDEDVDTENEIDLILMRDLVPIYVSCKNGMVEADELYKLNTVANRFGGGYVRKVLVATTLGRTDASTKYFLQRAEDMHIQVIRNVHLMSDAQFVSLLESLS